jgi:hypothetical protein
MKKRFTFIITLFFFLLVLTGLDKLVEFGLIRNNNIKESFAQRGNINADILFQGPCEVIWTINPDIVEEVTDKKAYNISHADSDFATNYLSIIQYLKHNKKPEKLVLFITPESFDDRYNTFHSYLFSLYQDSITRSLLKENSPGYARFHKWPLLRFTYFNRLLLFPAFQGLKHHWNDKTEPYFVNGYEPPIKMKWDNHYEELFKLYPGGVTFEWSTKREQDFLKIVKLCNDENIELITYESPVLNSSKPGQFNRSEILNKIKSLCSSQQVEFWSYDDSPLSKDKANFFSALNLNIEPGNQFTKDLALRLK